MKLDRLYIVLILIFVVSVIGLTFAVPFRTLRQEALDSTMSSALREVADEVKDYAKENNKLPDDLTSLNFEKSYSIVNNNPGILKKVTYNVVDNSSSTKKFNLCADFKTEKKSPYNDDTDISSIFSDDEDSLSSRYSVVDYQTHPKGYYCFDDEKVYSSSSSSLRDYYDSLEEPETESSDSSFDTLEFN